KNPKKGETFWVAVTLEPQKGWHTYWDNPGESGFKTTINWDLPKGVTVEKTLSSTPQRLMLEKLTTYVYETTAVHFAQLKISDNFDGDALALKLKADWLVCEDSCIPEKASLSLTLPLAKAHEKSSNLHPDLFEQWMKDVPQFVFEPITAHIKNKTLSLMLPDIPFLSKDNIQHIHFLPRTDIGMKYSAVPTFDVLDKGIRLDIPLAIEGKEIHDTTGLILVKHKDGSSKAYDIKLGGAVAPGSNTDNSLLLVLFFAFLGGIILNAMPCVFPILSLKALSIVQNQTPRIAKIQGLAYTVGVIASFILLGLIVILLKHGGVVLGWGGQMQSPTFVMLMMYLFFLIGLNLSGYFEITWTSGNKGQKLTEAGDTVTSHLRANFFTGVLATAVATPCTAPFMATAVGYALSADNVTLFLTMVALGLGLSLPFLALSFIPVLQHILPRPGQWMVTFRQFLAFPMYGSVIWLIWVLDQQIESSGIVLSGIGLLLCAFMLWFWSFISINNIFFRGIVGIFLSAVALSPLAFIEAKHSVIRSEDNHYSKEQLKKFLAEKKPVFVYATAAWCITCKFNEVALGSAVIEKYMKDNGIHVLVADWTNNDPEVTDFLHQFGRNGVPLYVFFSKNGEKPVILPQLLTTGNILSHLKEK
ncbi:MAG: thioredoxin family protein, partial [Alphaproteobacteria bacterium]|nr:thioredoxin family protein [Alphaproteobacteria bacterium]